MPRTSFTRRSIVFAMAMLLFGMPTWATEADVRQQKTDARLIDAIKLNNTNSVVRLLAQGASPNAQYLPMTGDEQISAIAQNTWPVRPKHMHLGPQWEKRPLPVSALIVALDVTLDCPSDCSLPPRHSALIKALVEAGADVNARGRYGNTSLLLAMGHNRRDIVALLLAHGANVFAKDEYGTTALMEAARMGDADLIRSLLKQGLDINAKSKPGMTPLMFACYAGNHGDVNTVQVLLEHGADVNAKNKDGKTTLMLAKMYANANIVSLLKKAGAK